MAKTPTRTTVEFLPPPPSRTRADKLTEDTSPATAGTTTKPDTDRLAVTLDSTGAMVLDGMRPSTKARLKAALQDPRVRAELGLTGPAGPAATISADDAAMIVLVTGALYDALSGLAVAVARARGFHETSANLMRFTADEKTQLAGPTMAVLAKYDLLGGKYKEELLLLVSLGSVMAGHAMAMQQAETSLSSGKIPAEKVN